MSVDIVPPPVPAARAQRALPASGLVAAQSFVGQARHQRSG
jgi:hypothetical protein